MRPGIRYLAGLLRTVADLLEPPPAPASITIMIDGQERTFIDERLL